MNTVLVSITVSCLIIQVALVSSQSHEQPHRRPAHPMSSSCVRMIGCIEWAGRTCAKSTSGCVLIPRGQVDLAKATQDQCEYRCVPDLLNVDNQLKGDATCQSSAAFLSCKTAAVNQCGSQSQIVACYNEFGTCLTGCSVSCEIRQNLSCKCDGTIPDCTCTTTPTSQQCRWASSSLLTISVLSVVLLIQLWYVDDIV